MRTECSRWCRWAVALVGAVVWLVGIVPARAQGVPPAVEWTVVVHGYQSGGASEYAGLVAPGGWMREIGRGIARIPGARVGIHTMSRADFSIADVEGPPIADATAHHVILFDWTESSAILNDGHAYGAGDALYAFITRWSMAGRVRCMIGHSRGAVVISETARRLTLQGMPPGQVVYLDGEGRGVDFLAFDDDEFDAWAGTGGNGGAAFNNLYTEFEECVPLGGHSRARCTNRNLRQFYSHADVCPNTAPGIYHLIMDTVGFGAGAYGWAETPGVPTTPPADPVQLDPASRPRPVLFNGDFGRASLAGWVGEGGGGSASATTVGGVRAAGIGGGNAVTHNYFMMPGAACELRLRAAKAAVASGNNELVVRLLGPGGLDTELARVRISTLGGSLQALPAVAVPAPYLGQMCRVRVQHVASGGFLATAYVGQIEIVPTALPANPAAPTVTAGCSSATVSRSGAPPAGVSWFWQGESCGTRMDLSADASIGAAPGSTQYLRARDNVTGQWSAACASVLVPGPTGCACSLADVAGVGGGVGPDGRATVDDVVVYLQAFFAGNAQIADVAALGGTGGPDGQITVDDLVRFLSVFFTGCP